MRRRQPPPPAEPHTPDLDAAWVRWEAGARDRATLDALVDALVAQKLAGMGSMHWYVLRLTAVDPTDSPPPPGAAVPSDVDRAAARWVRDEVERRVNLARYGDP